MRIIAGAWRGRPLAAPAGEATRPTSDRAREGLFSMLASRIGSFEGLRVADLYAGSGALGLEALSRGAALCCFVEQDRAALAALRANVANLGADERAEIRAQGVEYSAPVPSDIVLADPPYEAEIPLDRLASWVAPGGWLSVERGSGTVVQIPEGLELAAERRFGRATIYLLRRL